MFGRQKIATLVAEFLGAGILTLLYLSVRYSQIGLPFFISMTAGLTLAMLVFALGRVSTGYFNPVITFAMLTARKLDVLTAFLYIVVQMLGAWGAYFLYAYFVKNGLQEIGGKFEWRIFTAEAVGTGIFAFGLAAAYYQGLSRAATAAFSGLALMLGSVTASTVTLGILNPAVALGARAFEWAYILGPVLGALVGFHLYAQLFAERAVVAVRATSASRATATKKPVAKKKTASRKKK